MQSSVTRRSFLRQAAGATLGFTLAGCARLAAQTQTARRPNFVFILVDDLGWADLGCYGNTLHETPNLDGLARDSVRFTQAYAACAVCSPTRAAIQTGKYPIRMGITDWIPGRRQKGVALEERYTKTEMPLEEVTIAEALRDGGYKSWFVGKWHLGETEEFWPERQGYDVNLGGTSKGSPRSYFAPYRNERLEDGPDGEYLTDRLGDEAVRLIGEHAAEPERPFLMMMAFYAVHTPIQPRPDLKRKYDDKLAAMPESPWQNTGYAAMVEAMDAGVGKILAALERHGLERDTVVIFTSDNGGLERVTTNRPLSLGKGYYHEGGVRVPAIVRWPGRTRAGGVSECPIISMDFYPTMLEMARLEPRPKQHRDGLSLVPVLAGEARSLGRDELFWHYPHYHGAGETPSSAIRSGEFKFIRHYEDGRRELYHIAKDVGEQNNLVDALPDKAAALEAKLDAWLVAMNAYIPVRKAVTPTP